LITREGVALLIKERCIFWIYGIKRLGRKKVGYGKDHCNACEREAVVEKWRWFTWFHLFFIPVIPLGFHHEWICTLCERDSNARYKSGIYIKIFLSLFIFGVTALLFQPGATDGIEYGWIMKLLSALMFLASVFWLIKHKKQTSKKAFRKSITPIGTSTCLSCNEPLTLNLKLLCVPCKLEVYKEID